MSEILKDSTISKSDILGDDTSNSAGSAPGPKEIQ
jgi:hypothetical protein